MISFAKSGLAVFLFTVVAGAAFAQDAQTVTADGVSMIREGAVEIARDAAVEDARRKAVEQAVGLVIDSRTEVENFQVISDNVYSQAAGYIRRYRITGEKTEGDLLRVTISAEVALGKLSEDLDALNIQRQRMHNPRTIILVAEQNVAGEAHAWWRGGQQSDLGAVENALFDKFTEKGFEMIDHAAAAKKLRVTAAHQAQNLTVEQAKSVGEKVDAEVVIIGKAVSRIAGEYSGMRSGQADLAVKAVRIDTGQVIAALSTHAAAVHIDELAAGNEALKRAAAQAGDQLTARIAEAYAKELGVVRPVNITVIGLNKGQLVKFKDVLKNRVRGVKDVIERSFAGTTARISVYSAASAQSLSDELALKKFETFAVEVVGSTANTLELKAAPR